MTTDDLDAYIKVAGMAAQALAAAPSAPRKTSIFEPGYGDALEAQKARRVFLQNRLAYIYQWMLDEYRAGRAPELYQVLLDVLGEPAEDGGLFISDSCGYDNISNVVQDMDAEVILSAMVCANDG